MAEKTSWEILKEPNHIILWEEYKTSMELLIFLLSWGVEIGLAFTLAIIYLRT
jgi:hypothetical protein